MRHSVMLSTLMTLSLLPAMAFAQGANAKPAPGSPTADRLPIYEVDPKWPPTLPNDWIFGDIRGLFVDDRDHLWIIHMPSSLTDQEIGAAAKPPIADCCVPAPPVVELDPEGKVLRSWGGPGAGYTWFDQEHGIYIDHNGFVWMGTSNGHHVMKFTQDGKHVLTIGTPGVNKGSNDPDHLGGPANFYVEPKTNEIFIADGYRNKRVVVYDAATGAYKRHWGAYGKPPRDDERYQYPVTPANPPQQYSTLHGLIGTKDGLIYVSDRRGNRIQVFRQNGEYLMEQFVRPETGGSGSGFSLQVSRDPDQSLLYLIDGTNQRVWILRRKDLRILDRFGRPGRQSGEFIRAHMVAIDSKNRMYTGEAGNGRRIQRWVLKGTKPALTEDVFAGTWSVNPAKSTFNPGPGIRSQVVRFEQAGHEWRVLIESTGGDGRTIRSQWTGPFDGRDLPMTGDPNVDTRSFKRVDDYTLDIIAKKNGKVLTTTRTVYSKDGKTRVSTQTGVDAQGRQIQNRIFSEKQQ